jgi:hypothetical protein
MSRVTAPNMLFLSHTLSLTIHPVPLSHISRMQGYCMALYSAAEVIWNKGPWRKAIIAHLLHWERGQVESPGSRCWIPQILIIRPC